MSGTARRSWLALLAALALVGCRDRERSADGAARSFVDAVNSGDTDEVYELLAPPTQKRLAELARLASAHTGGLRKLEPADMLATGLAQIYLPLSEVKLVEESGERAKVKVVGAMQARHETLTLTRVDGRWRVLLPEAMFVRPDLHKDAPASQPTSP